MTTLLKIGGFIIFFSVVIEVLSQSGIINALAWVYSPLSRLFGISQDSVNTLLYGGIEMTNGCVQAAELETQITQKLSIIASIIAFGGLSIHMQTKAVCLHSGLRLKRFLIAKTLQGILAYLLCSLSLHLFSSCRRGFEHSRRHKNSRVLWNRFRGCGFCNCIHY